MFDESQTRQIPSDRFEEAMQGLAWSGTAVGVHLARVSPTSWMGKTAETSLGYALDTRVFTTYMGPWTQVTIKIEMSIEDKGAIFLWVSWAVCFPAAAVLWLLAYQDCTKRKAELFTALWHGSDRALPAGPAVGGPMHGPADPYQMGSGFGPR